MESIENIYKNFSKRNLHETEIIRRGRKHFFLNMILN